MTVLDVTKEFTIQSCPTFRVGDTEGAGNVTVDDRKAELLLMDEDVNTCLEAFKQGQRVFRLSTYVYVPQCLTSFRVVIHVLNVQCFDPQFIVYHQAARTLQADILHEECARGDSTDSSNPLECVFVCHNVKPVFDVVSVVLHLENPPTRSGWLPQICEIDVIKFW